MQPKNLIRAFLLAAALALPATPPPVLAQDAATQANESVVPAGFTEETLPLGETNLYVVSGGEGPAIILLHGFPEDWSAWRHMMPTLAEDHTVFAPDLRGLGGSTTTSEKFDAASTSADILGLMDAKGVGEAYLVGHDIGGSVAYALAKLHPERVRGLMLVESPPEGLPSWEAMKNSPLMWHMGFHQTPGLPEQLLAGREDIYVRHFLTESAAGEAPDEADVQRYAAAYRAPDRLQALLQIYRQFPVEKEFNLAHTEPTDIPLTQVGGERVFGPMLEDFAADFEAWGWSNVESVVVPDAGHYIADEAPEALTEIIADRAGE